MLPSGNGRLSGHLSGHSLSPSMLHFQGHPIDGWPFPLPESMELDTQTQVCTATEYSARCAERIECKVEAPSASVGGVIARTAAVIGCRTSSDRVASRLRFLGEEGRRD